MIHAGDVLDVLGQVEDESVQCVVTSPPYWGLRDYGTVGQIGLERTPEEYVTKMVEVFREVRRTMRGDGTLWLNLGDSYFPHNGSRGNVSSEGGDTVRGRGNRYQPAPRFNECGLKEKDLCGIPWRVAFALQTDGWWLRSDIIWSKPNPMPESVTDRPTKAHEYIFLLTKSARYYYDQDAVSEVALPHRGEVLENRDSGTGKARGMSGQADRQGNFVSSFDERRNARTVWTIPSQPFPEAHFATFPPTLPERCIKAGSKEGDTVLDPFCGAGTTGLVALRLDREFVGIELNPEYAEMAGRRIDCDAPLLNNVEVAV
jgi:DNA modification methylase